MLQVETKSNIAETCLKMFLHMYIFIPQKSPFSPLDFNGDFDFNLGTQAKKIFTMRNFCLTLCFPV